MVKRYALVRDGIIENVIAWDGKADLGGIEELLLECKGKLLRAGPGDTWDGFKLTRAQPEEHRDEHAEMEARIAALEAAVERLGGFS